MTYQEVVDDAMSDINALTSYAGITQSQKLRAVSTSIHELQKRTKVVKRDITIPTSALASDGSVALDSSITVPERVTFTPSGSSPSGTMPVEVITIGPSELARIKLIQANGVAPPCQAMYVALERGMLWFYPWQGVNGSFDVVAIAKLPIYADSRGAASTGDWAGWTESTISSRMATTNIPVEFEDAEEAIVAFTAAQLLALIPGWKTYFYQDYKERIARFESAVFDIEENQPKYPVNHNPKPNYGW